MQENINMKFFKQLCYTLFILASTTKISYTQNVDSLLTIWHQEDALPATRLNAINKVLANKSFYLQNFKQASNLSLHQYNFAKQHGTTLDVFNALSTRLLMSIHSEHYKETLELAEKILAMDL